MTQVIYTPQRGVASAGNTVAMGSSVQEQSSAPLATAFTSERIVVSETFACPGKIFGSLILLGWGNGPFALAKF